MPSFYLKQPNGKYARFSTIVDDFTVMGLTREEALDRAQREVGERDGFGKIERADADEEAAEYEEGAPEGLRRWVACLDTVRMVHGRQAMRERKRAGDAKRGHIPAACKSSAKMERVGLGFVRGAIVAAGGKVTT